MLQPQGTNTSTVTKGATGNHKQIQTIQALQTPCPARISGVKCRSNVPIRMDDQKVPWKNVKTWIFSLKIVVFLCNVF